MTLLQLLLDKEKVFVEDVVDVRVELAKEQLLIGNLLCIVDNVTKIRQALVRVAFWVEQFLNRLAHPVATFFAAIEHLIVALPRVVSHVKVDEIESAEVILFDLFLLKVVLQLIRGSLSIQI